MSILHINAYFMDNLGVFENLSIFAYFKGKLIKVILPVKSFALS